MGSLSRLLMALTAMLNFFLPISLAVDRNCDHALDLIVGKEYTIYNREYPQKYKSSTNCRWQVKSSEGTRIVLSCNAELPTVSHQNPFFNWQGNSKNQCEYQDKVLVSVTGQKNVGDGHSYCGNGSFSTVSDKNKLSVALLSTSSSKGGRFACSLTAIEVSSPVPSQNNTDVVASLAASCDCGWRFMTKIVGGEETGVNEFPSMAGLIWLAGNTLYCGATIISDRFLLTAAHCVYQRDYSKIAVLVGDHNISSGAETTYSAIYYVSAYEYHPNYTPNTLANDVGIIQTSTTMVFSLRVGPICLPFRFTLSSFYGQIATVVGWGATEYSGPRSDVLLKANLNIVSNEQCAQGQSNPVTTSQICTYTPEKDACTADSGGPLLWTDTSTNRMQLVGVISQGLGCASSIPSIYARVTSYLTWIVARTNVAFCIR